jgi:putative phosphoribosyl transferase
MFADRIDAGRRLAAKLSAYADQPNTIVLGIPRGGVVVAAEVARTLHLPLDIVLAAKVGAPGNPEFAAGALTADGELVANPAAGLSTAELSEIADDAHAKITRQLESLRGNREPVELTGRTAIVVDDGLATGLTARAAVRFLRRQGAASIVLAVPVAAADSARRLAAEVDELVAVEIRDDFFAVGQFYAFFDQTEDSEVRRLLTEMSVAPDSGK